MLELIVRYLFLVVILMGLYQYISKKIHIKEEFIPIFLFTTVGSLIFLAGLLNVMVEVQWLISLFAIYHFIKSLFYRDLELPSSQGMFVFLGLFIYFAFLLKGKMISHYDDFSHWGLVVKEIVAFDQFPSASSELITFQAYPTGSASFIYFIAKILGDTEGVFLYAQSLLIAASLTTFFSLIKKNRLISGFIIFIAAVFFLTANNSPFMLLVDTLMPILALAMTTIIVYHAKNDKPELAIIPALPIGILLIVIKNTGMFFVIGNILLLSYLLLKKKGFRYSSLKQISLFALVPFIFSRLWSQHVKFTFPSGLESKHSLSISQYESIFESKTPEEIQEIVDLFFERMTGFEHADVQISLLILMIFLVVIGYKVFARKETIVKILEAKLVVTMLALYVFYQAALLGTYLFSMPTNEALVLAAYERYSYTIILYLYGLLILWSLNLLQDTKLKYNRGKVVKGIVILSLATIPVVLRNRTDDIKHLITLEQRPLPSRDKLLSAIEYQTLPEDARIYIYISDDNQLNHSGVLRYIAMYDLHNPRVSIIDQDVIDESIIDKGDYLIILKEDSVVNELVEQHNLNHSSDSIIILEESSEGDL